jgi:hypothetical protein
MAASAHSTPNEHILWAKDVTNAIAQSLLTPLPPERQERLLGWVNPSSRASQTLWQLQATSVGPALTSCALGDDKDAYFKSVREALQSPWVCDPLRAAGGACEVHRDDRGLISSLSLGALEHGARLGARWFSAAACDDVPSEPSGALVMQIGAEKSFKELAVHPRDTHALDDVILALGTEVIGAWVVFPSGLADLWEGRTFKGENDPIALSMARTSRGVAVDWVLSPKAIAEGFELLALRAK